MLNKSAAYMVIDRILSTAGSIDMQVTLKGSNSGLTRFASSEIHQNVTSENLEAELLLKKDKKEVKVTTNKFSSTNLRNIIQKAIELLQSIPERNSSLTFIDKPSDISHENDYSDLAEEFNIKRRAERIGEGIRKISPDLNVAGSLALNQGFIAIGNTNNITRYVRTDKVEFSTVVTEKSGSTGYAARISDNLRDLDIDNAFKKAANKAVSGRNPKEVKPGVYTVILEPAAVGNIISYLAYIGFSGRSVQEGMSFLTDRLGEQVFGENITIRDDCNNADTMDLPFDLEGAKRQPLDIIINGVARDLAYDIRSAQKDDRETTGHSVGQPEVGGFPLHLVMEPGSNSLDKMLVEAEDAIHITKFHYVNVVNPRKAVLTGLTKDGTFIINKDNRTPIKNMRFTQSMLESLNKVSSISKEREKVAGFNGFMYLPALKIEDFKFTGISK
ncbi:MAG: TldD/PmbA family protein [Bacillota bacterium]